MKSQDLRFKTIKTCAGYAEDMHSTYNNPNTNTQKIIINVLENSRTFRRIVVEISQRFPESIPEMSEKFPGAILADFAALFGFTYSLFINFT